jgi:ubiquinol-cytochrome c reductase cytochrome b subunit
MFFRRALLHIIHAHAFYYPTPLNLTYFWGLGSVSGIFLVLQMVTGIFLAMYYVPSVEYAFASIDYIMREVNYGWLIRFAHTNGASFFFFIVYAHIGRTLYFGYYFYQRRFLWFSGIILFLLMMATAFLGYVLPWGQMSFWGATVITNLFTAIPFVGKPFALWLWGGYSVGAATLTRFFSFHYCLPFIIVAVVLIHLVLLHQDGSNNNFGILAVPDKISFYPYFYVKDYFGLLVIILVYAGFIFYTPDLLNHPDNYIEANPLVTPAHIVPEWYFLPFYAILRSVPNKLGGVVAMALAIFIYFFLPFGFRAVRSLYIGTRFLHQVTVWYFFGVIVILGILGGRPIEDPYLFVSQLFVFLYFLFFSVLVWLDHFVAEVQNRGVSFIRSFTFSGYSFFLGDTQTLTPAIIRTLGIRSSVAMSQVKYVRKRLARGDLSFWILSRINTAWQALSTSIFLTHRFFSAAIKYRLLFLSKTARIASHPFHLVTESPWPVLVAFSFFGLMLSLVAVMHDYIGLSALWAVLFLVICVTAWFIDMVNESTFEGSHTYLVQRGLKLGVILFIVSEVMFFFFIFLGVFSFKFNASLPNRWYLASGWY